MAASIVKSPTNRSVRRTPKRIKRIVFTGAPSSGKSTVLGALKNLVPKSVVLVPETATMLLMGGYPPPAVKSLAEQRAFQGMILNLQKNLEEMLLLKNPGATHMILDRATLDGAAYWPKGPQGFYREFGINFERELKKYDHVLFFNLPAQKHFGGTHQNRFHDYGQSNDFGKKQHAIWKKHSSFIEIPAYDDFSKKVKHVIDVLLGLI